MSGSTRRKITIRQSSPSIDPIRRLYQLQQQRDIDSGQFLFPTTEDNSTVIGWSYTGFGVRRTAFGSTYTDDSPVPTEVPRDVAFPHEGVEGAVGLPDIWQNSIDRQTPDLELDFPSPDTVDFYDRIGGSLFADLNSYNTVIYYARALSDMAYDSLAVREEQIDEIRELDGSTPTSVRRLNDMLAVAGAGLFERQQGVERYEDVSDLNLFILDHIVMRNPEGDFDPRTQARVSRTTPESNTILDQIFPPVDSGERLERENANVYRTAANYLPDGQTLGDFILEIIAERYGEDSVNYRLAVQAAILGNQEIEDLPPSTFSSEYFDFQAEAPFFEDYATSVAKNFLTPQNPNVLSFARATPEYNYFSETYEKAIANEKIPEPILPNMYYYKFATNQRQLDLGIDRDFNLEEGYDTLITFNDFNTEVLPNIESENFQNYIDNIYPQMTRNVSVDLVTQLGEQYQTATTPGAGMSVYSELNSLKINFPMYAEFSLPTPAAGEFGQLIENNITSDVFTKALEAPGGNLQNPSVGLRPMRVVSDAYDIGDLFQEDTQEARQSSVLQAYNNGLSLSDIENSFGTYEVPLLNETEFGVSLAVLEIYEFDIWFNNVVTSLQDNENQQDRRLRDLGPIARLQLQAIRNRVNQLKNQKMKDYSAAMEGELCESETIAYRLIKRDPSNNLEIIQNFYFANTSFVDVIDFVDTQVKYDKEYVYEINAYSLVYGSKFTFSTIGYREDFETKLVRLQGPNRLNYLPPFAKFKIFTEPSVKIVEYPIFNSDWNTSNRLMALPEAHGLSIPPLRILDEPPMPPQMEILPYQGNAQNILLNFQVGVGRSQDHNGAAPNSFINMQQSDTQDLQRLALYQKSFKHYDIISPELYFESESETEIKEMQIYRTTDMDLLAVNEQEIYNSFGKEPYKILNISGDPDLPPDQIALSFDCIDTIQPNTKYYYTARSVDVHGNKSNPCAIMQVEIIFENGLVYPSVQRYVPKPPPISNRTKKMNRFVEIKAADIQTYVYNQRGQNDEPDVSKQGLVEEAQYQVANNDFILRFVSRDTGRRFDLKISFDKQSKAMLAGDSEPQEGEMMNPPEGEMANPPDQQNQQENNQQQDGGGYGRPPL